MNELAPDLELLDEDPPRRILLVEDNAGDAYLVRMMLMDGLGGRAEVITAGDLATAEQEILTPVDCVLLDLSLPDAEGMDALQSLRSMAPDLPIVVLTGRDDVALATRALKQGAQDYLIKGQVDAQLLTRSIRYAVARNRAEQQLVHQALHDPLTGLPNRSLFLDRLRQALARSERHGLAVAVMFIDLDRFKIINDSLGHQAGDQILCLQAARLREALRPGDTVARFGGDEFTILCEEVEIPADIAIIAERVAHSLSQPVPIGTGDLYLTVSVGIALSSASPETAEVLIRNADAAMYQAKDRGRNRYEMFDAEMHLKASRRLEVTNDLHRAVERREFKVVYQPLMQLDSGRITGLEALVRWQHPERGLLDPDEFIALAEETGLIIPLGTWVLEQACLQLRKWSVAGLDLQGLYISVNVSARQLSHGLVGIVAEILQRTGADPALLCLEITESAVVEDLHGALTVLLALKELGLRLCMDDFGTGYASLTYLRKLPVDLIKVDRSFVAGLGRDADDGAIVAAVVGLAKALRITAVAEGVERPEQMELLRGLDCEIVQGHLLGFPVSPREIETMMAAAADLRGSRAAAEAQGSAHRRA